MPSPPRMAAPQQQPRLKAPSKAGSSPNQERPGPEGAGSSCRHSSESAACSSPAGMHGPRDGIPDGADTARGAAKADESA